MSTMNCKLGVREVADPELCMVPPTSIPTLDLSASTFNRALRDVAQEELALVRTRYLQHRDPVRCAIGISLVLRSLAKDLFGDERIDRLHRVSWLNFLLRTSNTWHAANTSNNTSNNTPDNSSANTSDTQPMRPDVLETMSAALYGDPPEMELPRDCSFWFDAAEAWIDQQRDRQPVIPRAKPVEVGLRVAGHLP